MLALARGVSIPWDEEPWLPIDGLFTLRNARERNTELVCRYATEYLRWRVSLQTHKLMGLR